LGGGALLVRVTLIGPAMPTSNARDTTLPIGSMLVKVSVPMVIRGLGAL